ncbi:hypothetical protein [Haliangium sp.]|uniref:hypothetical protein n=1 Tax=Haliangium sp. TaxID=2663208 RepID=UPI003D0AFECB
MPDAATPDKVQLRVSLYPWVPEADSLASWIEQDFETQHPEIDLVVRTMERSYDWLPGYVSDLAYEIDQTVAALTQEGDDSQDLIEVDTMILGALIERNAVAPFALSEPSFLPSAQEAVSQDGETWGVPHWTCGYFVISEDAGVREANDLTALLDRLADAGTERADIVGDIDGSWDAVMVYLDAFIDSYGDGDVQAALAAETLDPMVDSALRALGTSCAQDGEAMCGSDGVEKFATGGADALIGYSERLHPILATEGRTVANLHIASAPLGSGSHPMLFTDALVLSPRCSSERCQEAARAFASYYVSDRVFEVVLMGLDTDTSVARYLLPSTTTAFDTDAVAADPYYRQLEEEIQGARAYPTSGVPEARERGAIQAQVKTALGL